MPAITLHTRPQYVAMVQRLLDEIDTANANSGPIEINPGSPWPPKDPPRDYVGRIKNDREYREVRHPNPRVAEAKARLEAIRNHAGWRRFTDLARPIIDGAHQRIAAAGFMVETGEASDHMHLLVQRYACEPKENDDPHGRIEFNFDHELNKLFISRGGQEWPVKPGEPDVYYEYHPEVYAFDVDNWLTDTWLRGLVYDTAVRGLHRLRGYWRWSKSHPIPDTLEGVIAFTRGQPRDDVVGDSFSGGNGNEFLGDSWGEYVNSVLMPAIAVTRRMLLARGYYCAIQAMYRGRGVQLSVGYGQENGAIGFACRGDTVVVWSKYGSARPSERGFDLGDLIPPFAYHHLLAGLGQCLGKAAGPLLMA